MKAFVINEDQIKVAGLSLVVVIALAFLSGYFTGSAQLFSSNKVSTQEEKLALEKAGESGSKNEITPVLSAAELKAKNASDKIKKTKPLEKKSEKKSVKKTTPRNNKKNNKKDDKKIKNKVDNKKQAKENKKAAEKKVVDKKVVDKNRDSKVDKTKKTTDKIVDHKSKTKPTNENQTYSIQTGMFSNENNAKAFIEKLSLKNFDAYTNDFVSSSGAIKFNVRIGKFSSREQARELLKEFQKSFSSPAYVVISQP